MAHQWFVIRNGKEQGPLTAQQLKQLAASGQLRPEDLVRRDDREKPIPAKNVQGLLPAAQPIPTPAAAATSTSPASTAAVQLARPGKHSNVLLGAVGVVIGLMFFCCGGYCILGMILSGQQRTGGLTAGFYPFESGSVRYTLKTVYIPNAGQLQSENEYTHDSDGVIQVRCLKHFAVHEWSTPRYSDLPLTQPKQVFRRERDGFVEIGEESELTGETVWHPLIKIGAKVGEQWQREVVPGVKETYRLKKFQGHDMKFSGLVPGDWVFSAYLEKKVVIEGGDEPLVFVHEIELGRGVGLIEQTVWHGEGSGRREAWHEFLSHRTAE